MKCSVLNCKSNNEGKACSLSFFVIPSDPVLKRKWINFCGRGVNINSRSAICMLHFKTEDIANGLQYDMGFARQRLLKRDAVPTINATAFENVELSERQTLKIEKRKNKKIVETILQDYETDADVQIKEEPEEIETFQAFSYKSNESADLQKAELETLYNENRVLKKKLKQLEPLRHDIEQLKKKHESKIKVLKKKLTKTERELANLEKKLLNVLTRGQVSKMKADMRKRTWTEEDITKSARLYGANAKLYKLLYQNDFPLPAVRTLQNWPQLAKKKINLDSKSKALSTATHTSRTIKEEIKTEIDVGDYAIDV